jgi:ribosomal protein S6E (S10)
MFTTEQIRVLAHHDKRGGIVRVSVYYNNKQGERKKIVIDGRDHPEDIRQIYRRIAHELNNHL